MGEVLDWRPIRYLTVDHIGAIIEIRAPTRDGYDQMAAPFVLETIEVPTEYTSGGHPRFERVRLNDHLDTAITAYDGDEYREHKN